MMSPFAAAQHPVPAQPERQSGHHSHSSVAEFSPQASSSQPAHTAHNGIEKMFSEEAPESGPIPIRSPFAGYKASSASGPLSQRSSPGSVSRTPSGSPLSVLPLFGPLCTLAFGQTSQAGQNRDASAAAKKSNGSGGVVTWHKDVEFGAAPQPPFPSGSELHSLRIDTAREGASAAAAAASTGTPPEMRSPFADAIMLPFSRPTSGHIDSCRPYAGELLRSLLPDAVVSDLVI